MDALRLHRAECERFHNQPLRLHHEHCLRSNVRGQKSSEDAVLPGRFLRRLLSRPHLQLHHLHGRSRRLRGHSRGLHERHHHDHAVDTNSGYCSNHQQPVSRRHSLYNNVRVHVHVFGVALPWPHDGRQLCQVSELRGTLPRHRLLRSLRHLQGGQSEGGLTVRRRAQRRAALASLVSPIWLPDGLRGKDGSWHTATFDDHRSITVTLQQQYYGLREVPQTCSTRTDCVCTVPLMLGCPRLREFDCGSGILVWREGERCREREN